MAEAVATTHLGRDYLKQKVGRGGLYPYLEYLSLDTVKWDDDFLGDTLHGGYISTAAGNASAVAALLAGSANGEVKLDAGDADDGYSTLRLNQLSFQGQLNAVMAARVKINDIVGVKLEVGFIDGIGTTYNTTGAVSTLGSPEFTGTGHAPDCAVWVWDTDDTNYLQAFGNKGDAEALKIEPSEALVNDTYRTFIVALRDTSARFFLTDANGRVNYKSDWMLNAITAADLLCPWIMVLNRTGATSNAVIDYLRVWQRRTTS